MQWNSEEETKKFENEWRWRITGTQRSTKARVEILPLLYLVSWFSCSLAEEMSLSLEPGFEIA